MKEPLQMLLDELRETCQKPDPAALYYLSNLDAQGADRVCRVWTELPADLRVELTTWMVEMAEADFTLNFGAIFRMGMEDRDPRVREAAIDGLWEDEDVRLVPPLAERLREDESTRVRAAAAKSLGRYILLGELERIRPRPLRMAYEALLEAYQRRTEHAEVKRRALESLAYVCDDTVVTSIREAYGSSTERVRISAVFAMGRSADTRWEREVQQELFSTNPEMRYEAARACGKLQLSEAVSMLEELTEDADIEVQQAAIWALGQVGGDRAREILDYYCQVSDQPLRSAAEAAVREFEFLHGDLEDVFAELSEEPCW